jgi:hypothetical protein
MNDEPIDLLREKFREAESALRGVAETMRGAKSAEEHFVRGEERISKTAAAVEGSAMALAAAAGKLQLLMDAMGAVVAELRKADSESLRKEVARLAQDLDSLQAAVQTGALTKDLAAQLAGTDRRIQSVYGLLEGDMKVGQLDAAVARNLAAIRTDLVNGMGEHAAEFRNEAKAAQIAVEAAARKSAVWAMAAVATALLAAVVAALR